VKSEFLLAITQLSAEKNLPKEVVLGAVEAALVSAYRKDSFGPNQEISVKIDTATGKVRVWAKKTVVEVPSDTRSEISLDEAHRINPDAQLDDVVEVEATPRNAGRIAAQTAKQVILQRLHEAEHSAIMGEYAGKEADIITGLVRRIEPKQIFIDLGRAEAILPAAEQVANEKYRIGQRLRVYLLEVSRTNRGSRVVVSRSHSDMLRRLLELEVPEVVNGVVEIKAVAREAGFRSKVAVAAKQEGVDPVGCCVGLRGIRIQNIVSELNGEKIDVVAWSPDASAFITNALSPAQVLRVGLGDEAATVVVPDKQLSLAIGKAGQNVRLAAKLTGWRIDIKSASEAEEKDLVPAGVGGAVEAEPVAAEGEEVVAVAEEAPAEAEASIVAEPTLAPKEMAEKATLAPVSIGPQEAAMGKGEIKFAEDIMAPPSVKPVVKSRKKKKAGRKKTGAVDGIKIKRVRQAKMMEGDEELEDIEGIEGIEQPEEVEKIEEVGEVKKAEKIEKIEEVGEVKKAEKVEKIEEVGEVKKAEKVEKPKKAKKAKKAKKVEKVE
jgi:N utilization substance protein A